VLAGGLAFALAALLVPLVRRVALQLGVTNQPVPDRWHTAPTPYLGGVGLAAAFIGGSLVVDGWERDVGLLVGAATSVSLLGLVDDVRVVSPAVRILVEAAAGVAAFAAGCRTDIGPDAVDLALTVAVVVVLTNAFNLLDNIDGGLGSIMAVVALGVGVAALAGDQVRVGGFALALAGASLGFLVHNWHPASIFMGDAGSLFLGFLIAALTLRLRTAVEPAASAVAGLLLVGPALFDTTLVAISRVRMGRSVLVGGTDHTSHRLVRMGLSTEAAVAVIVLGSLATTTLGVAVARDWLAPLPVLALVGPAFAVLLAVLLRQPPGDTEAAVRPPAEGVGP
jgi:UDP-GlcNAc:undecaprenyl-phosphate/decaprenyl-phosphate GlcNAc-1-phosphate transferase